MPGQGPEDSGRRKGRPQGGGEVLTVSDERQGGFLVKGRRLGCFTPFFLLYFLRHEMLFCRVEYIQLRGSSLKSYPPPEVPRVSWE